MNDVLGDSSHPDYLDAVNHIQNQLGIPVIYSTACSDQDTLDQIETIGGYGLISKSFQIYKLNKAIQTTLGPH